MAKGDEALDSQVLFFWLLLSNTANLVTRLFGPQLAWTLLLAATRGLESSGCTGLRSPSHVGHLISLSFFRLGRAMRVVLPLSSGGVAHLFVVYGHQGSESDADQLALTDQLITLVLCEAKVCCTRQPDILVGDLDAGPSIIPFLAKGIYDGGWVGLEKSLRFGQGSRACSHLSVPSG